MRRAPSCCDLPPPAFLPNMSSKRSKSTLQGNLWCDENFSHSLLVCRFSHSVQPRCKKRRKVESPQDHDEECMGIRRPHEGIFPFRARIGIG